MSRRLRLLCDTNPMCYGSSTALLCILDHLDAKATAIGRDVTLEILTTDRSLERVIEVDTKQPDAVAAALDPTLFDAVLVLSNQANVELYASLGLPIFFVDILYWFGARKDQPVWALAEQTFVQDFPGVEERLAQGRTPGSPTVVGPLIRPIETGATAGGTLAHIGGARSRWVRPGVNSPFAALAARWLTELEDALPGPLMLACGADAAREARRAVPALDARPFPQREFLRHLGECDLFLTTPGLNAVFEGLASGRPMGFLPPQNASQVRQLERYEQAGLVRPGLNLPALDPEFPADDFPEAGLTQEVLRSLDRIARSEAIQGRVLDHLRMQLDHPLRGGLQRLSSRPPGGATVANAIRIWWDARC